MDLGLCALFQAGFEQIAATQNCHIAGGTCEGAIGSSSVTGRRGNTCDNRQRAGEHTLAAFRAHLFQRDDLLVAEFAPLLVRASHLRIEAAVILLQRVDKQPVALANLPNPLKHRVVLGRQADYLPGAPAILLQITLESVRREAACKQQLRDQAHPAAVCSAELLQLIEQVIGHRVVHSLKGIEVCPCGAVVGVAAGVAGIGFLKPHQPA